MKDYKRLTKWSDLGTLHIFDFVGKEILLCDISPLDTDNLAGRLAELEDKIESGELVDRDEYLDRLMAAKDISGMTDREIEFFAKHNARVRENADDTIRKEVVKECLHILHNTGMTYLYDTHSWDGIEVIDIAIKRLAEKYNIDIEEDEE